MNPLLSVVVVHYRNPAYTREALRCFRRFAGGRPTECIVVSNEGANPVADDPDASIVSISAGGNRGYAGACNLGARAAQGEFVFFANNDVLFEDDVVGTLLATAAGDRRIGVVGPRLEFPGGRFQLSYGEDPDLVAEYRERRRQRQSRTGAGSALHARENESAVRRDADWITGAAMLVRRAAYDAVGGFDEGFFFYFEDADFCRRVRAAGFRCVYEPSARMTHLGGGSEPGSDPIARRAYRLGQLRYYSKHNTRVSFSTLKLYLAARCVRPRARGDETDSVPALTLRDILRTPYRMA